MSFIPTDKTGCKLWLNANAITGLNNGDDVSSWTDDSETGNTPTQATASEKPHYMTNVVNGKPVVRFSAAASQLLYKSTITGVPTGNNPLTVFIVLASTQTTYAYTLYWGLAECVKAFHFITAHSATYDWFYGINCHGVDAGFTGCNDGNFHYASITYNGTLAKIWKDGVAGANNTYTTWNNQNVNLYVGFGEGATYFTGDIAEIIIYDTALSDSDRESVESYLASKYAIGAQEYTNPLSDSQTITEEQKSRVVLNLTDSLEFAEQLSTGGVELSKDLSDDQIISEEISVATTTFLELSDAVIFSESLVKKITVEQSDAVSFAEAVANKNTLSLSDSQNITEGNEYAWVVIRSLADSQNLTETFNSFVSLVKSDSLSIEESVSIVCVIKLSLIDEQTFTESLFNTVELAVSDSVLFTEAVIFKSVLNFSDSIIPTEDLSKSIVLNISDAVSFAESFTTNYGAYFPQDLSDNITISEEQVKNISLFKSDTEPVGESVTNQNTLNLSESLNIAESFNRTLIKQVICSDVVSFSESLVVWKGIKLVFADSQTFSENSVWDLNKVFSESQTITENSIQNIIVKRSLVDSITFDAIMYSNYQHDYNISMVENITFSDEIDSVYKIMRAADLGFMRSNFP